MFIWASLAINQVISFHYTINNELLLETKAIPQNDSLSSYSGIVEKGSNWYVPDWLTIRRWSIDVGS